MNNGPGWWLDALLGISLILILLLRFGLRKGSVAQPEPEGKFVLRGYERMLRQAGFDPGGPSVMAYWALKALLAALLPLLLMQWGVRDTLGLFIASAVGFFTPDIYLLQLRRFRIKQIQQRLSFFVDLVVALLRSGIALDRAFLRATREGFADSHPLAEEVELVGREVEMGKNRAAAFESLYERTGTPDLRVITAAVSMGLKHGTPITETLAIQADLLRAKRRERAMRKINGITVLALIPVMLCGFPLWIIIVYFPAALELKNLFEAFKTW